MHQRDTPLRTADRVLVVANLEDDWEPLIGWVLSRMQEGDVLYLLHLIQCQDGAEDGEPCDGTCERSLALFHQISQDRYVRDRVALLVSVMRELGGFYLGIKVLTSKRVVHATELPSVIQEECHAVDATNVVMSGTGWYEGSTLALRHACHPLLAQISSGLAPSCLITVVEGARLADVKRGQLGAADLPAVHECWPREEAAGEASWADGPLDLAGIDELDGLSSLRHAAYLLETGANGEGAGHSLALVPLEPSSSTASSLMARLRLPRLMRSSSKKAEAAEASVGPAKRQWGKKSRSKASAGVTPVNITWQSVDEAGAAEGGGLNEGGLGQPFPGDTILEDILEEAEMNGGIEYVEGNMLHESAIGHVDNAYLIHEDEHAVGSPEAYYTDKWDQHSAAGSSKRSFRAQRRKGTPKAPKHTEPMGKGGSILGRTLSILLATDPVRSGAVDPPQAFHEAERMAPVNPGYAFFSSRPRY